MNLFRRSEAAPAPIRKSEAYAAAYKAAGARPITIQRTPKGLLFISNETGLPVPKADAIAMMRAYKHGSESKPSVRQPKARKASAQQYQVAVYATDLRSGKSKPVLSRTFPNKIAAAWALADICEKLTAEQRSGKGTDTAFEYVMEAA